MAMHYLGETLDIHTGGIDLVFPHHENEIAQSEAATGKPFVRYWLHAEHLIVEGEKMSKSLGNFFTLRDLLARGYKPSAIRYLLASVPYRRQFNFTFDGLQQAASSVERLRNFVVRLKTEKFAEGSSEQIRERIRRAEQMFVEALADDLNTAVALAAAFDLVRDINTAMDQGEFRRADAPAVLAFLDTFDSIFAVLAGDDTEKMRALGFAVAAGEISDAEIEALIAERQAARKKRDFQRADEIRAQLAARGIILEDTKDGGVRWKRK
jgi:cysteinyl-tRNA synthetase